MGQPRSLNTEEENSNLESVDAVFKFLNKRHEEVRKGVSGEDVRVIWSEFV